VNGLRDHMIKISQGLSYTNKLEGTHKISLNKKSIEWAIIINLRIRIWYHMISLSKRSLGFMPKEWYWTYEMDSML